jgi:flavin reductase (DIM6/NTAB) family NADH-FMN oxidoreductase RutF
MPDHDSKHQLQRALGRIASGLSIVTVRLENESSAFLASWVQQAGFEPPMLSVAVGKDRPAARLLDKGGSFVVNVLGNEDSAGLLKHFSKGFAPGVDAFAGLNVERHEGGAEILPDCLASLQCEPRGKVSSADHTLYLGEVIHALSHRDDDESAVHLRKNGLRY